MREKVFFVLLSVCTCLALAGCRNDAGKNGAVSKIECPVSGGSVVQTSEGSAKEESKETNVSYECELGSIAFYLPEGWNYETTEYQDDTDFFGIKCWKGKEKNFAIDFHCSDFVGLCGTGIVRCEKMTINGMPAEMGYVSKNEWEYVVFMDDYKNYIIMNLALGEKGGKAWWKKNEDEIREMWDSLVLRPAKEEK